MLHLVVAAAALAPPEVSLDPYGKLSGAWDTSSSAVAAFRDVPYAEAGRFEVPKPPKPWSGTRDASKFGVGCAQRGSSHNPDVPTNRSEDCQRLNVFAPWPPRMAKPVPVMVWWHGGAYTEGSSYGPFDLYDGGKIVAHSDVVIVSCNYRLGAVRAARACCPAHYPSTAHTHDLCSSPVQLGALVHDGGLGGNYGFLDQRACLQWVQANAITFGGDAANVTVWGQSAGAQSIWLHMASNRSTGLFHRAILESAVDLSLFTTKQAAKLGRETAKLVGCTEGTDAERIACLRAADLDALLDAANKAQGSFLTIAESISLKHPTGSFLPFKPNIDGIEFVEQPFATLLGGRAPAAVPAIVGFNHDEMWALLSSLPSWLKGFEVEAGLMILFGASVGVEAWRHYSALYPGDTTAAVVKILTDYLFTCAGQASALALPRPSYVYQYNHVDSFGPTIFNKFGLPQCAVHQRVCHMAEIPLVFNNSGPASLNASLTPAEHALSATIIDAFTSFVKGGSPEGSTGWAPFTTPQRAGLLINQTAKAAPLGEAATVCTKIWDKTGYLI